MALSKQSIELLNNMNMIAQQDQLGEQINNAIVAGENGEVTKAIAEGDANTLKQAKAADATLKQEITKTIEDKHKGILTLTKMKKHSNLASDAQLSAVITEVNALIADLIKCGIMSNQ